MVGGLQVLDGLSIEVGEPEGDRGHYVVFLDAAPAIPSAMDSSAVAMGIIVGAPV